MTQDWCPSLIVIRREELHSQDLSGDLRLEGLPDSSEQILGSECLSDDSQDTVLHVTAIVQVVRSQIDVDALALARSDLRQSEVQTDYLAICTYVERASDDLWRFFTTNSGLEQELPL